MKFDEKGLAPLIVQNANNGQVISLFYVNKEAIDKIKQTGYIWRYSRQYEKLMKKGETSGNTQKVVGLKEDCDKDALIALVELNGPGCHTSATSCFNALAFSNSFLYTLEKIITERKQNPKEKSYTNELLKNDELLKEKLREELEEFINFTDKQNLTWEAADLLYFALVYLAKNNVKLNDVEKHLASLNNIKKIA